MLDGVGARFERINNAFRAVCVRCNFQAAAMRLINQCCKFFQGVLWGAYLGAL